MKFIKEEIFDNNGNLIKVTFYKTRNNNILNKHIEYLNNSLSDLEILEYLEPKSPKEMDAIWKGKMKLKLGDWSHTTYGSLFDVEAIHDERWSFNNIEEAKIIFDREMYHFDDYNKLIKFQKFASTYDTECLIDEIEYKYNEDGDLISSKIYNVVDEIDMVLAKNNYEKVNSVTYEYLYDKKGRWTDSKIFKNSKLVNKINRHYGDYSKYFASV